MSDQTGVTAETMGHSLLTQFEGMNFQTVTLPFISSLEKAEEARQMIDAAAVVNGLRPIIFSTLVRESEREIVKRSNALFLDFFDAFMMPLEAELGITGSHALGRAHGMFDLNSYMTRIDATNFALANDDGGRVQDYGRADVVVIGVSRSGKTPTCLYLALQYGIYAANYPLTEDDLDSGQLPTAVRSHTHKLFGLTIEPQRLQQIRHARRPNSRYSSPSQVNFELRAAERLFERYQVPHVDTTNCSVEEIASRILQKTGVVRRLLP